MAKKREAIVLAGGSGTRLAHCCSDVPKPGPSAQDLFCVLS